MTVIDIAGAGSALLVLLAYGLLQTGRLTTRDLDYQILNLIGSMLALAYFLSFGAWMGVFVQAFWLAVTLVSLFK